MAADRLLAEASADDLGHTTASVYETARLVSIAPWLTGHDARIDYLCAKQASDGAWGEPGHRLVPTLSATEALLATLSRPSQSGPALTHAAELALRSTCRLLASTTDLPDTVAVELIVPALIESMNEYLSTDAVLPPQLSHWTGSPRFAAPPGTSRRTFAKVRDIVAAGRPVPEKLWHTWEIIGPAGRRSAQVYPVAGGISCSPAATAAWSGMPVRQDEPALDYLRRVQQRHGGPVPVAAPIVHFERAWLLNILATNGVPHTAPDRLLDSLEAAFGPEGVPGGPGLPPDADDTAATLYALALHGRPRRPDVLMSYLTDDHFVCYPGERTPSASTNAHVLEALMSWTTESVTDQQRFGPAITKVVDWLLGAQYPDGSWTDKWHASPYYATACCTQALTMYGDARCAPALAKAVAWVLDTQLPNGRWGSALGTVEETCYATCILGVTTTPGGNPAVAKALTAARSVLDAPDDIEDAPGLWYDKDTYAPIRILRALRLAAHQHVGRTGQDG